MNRVRVGRLPQHLTRVTEAAEMKTKLMMLNAAHFTVAEIWTLVSAKPSSKTGQTRIHHLYRDKFPNDGPASGDEERRREGPR